jgi:polar amino acid transport system substrate-binding protein
MTLRTIFITALSLIGLLVAVVLWLFARKPEDQIWEEVLASGVLRVGVDASYLPFESLDETGKFTGFDIDLANGLGSKMGIPRIEFINIAYDGLYDALLTRKVDVLISALAIVPQYQGRAVFSTPYFNAGEMLIVPTNSSITKMEALSGQRVAVEYGSDGDAEARRWERRLSALHVIRYPDANAAITALLEGEADAVLVDGISGRLALGQHRELAFSLFASDSLFAIASHPDSLTLSRKIDEALHELFRDGSTDRLTEKWFGPQRTLSP